MTRVVDADVVHAGGEDTALGLVLVHMRKHFAEPLSTVALARIAGRLPRSQQAKASATRATSSTSFATSSA